MIKNMISSDEQVEEHFNRLRGQTGAVFPQQYKVKGTIHYFSGMVARQHYASLALQGLLSSSYIGHDPEKVAAMAVKMADALIAELSK